MTVDNEIPRNIFHSNVDIERPTDDNGTAALKEYATSWKATVMIHFGSHDDLKMLCGTIMWDSETSTDMECVKTNDQQWNRIFSRFL